MQAGDAVGAESALRRTVETGGGVRAWWSLARGLEDAGRADEARDAYRQVIARGRVDDPRLAAAQQRLHGLDGAR